jgi:hypothetical protein
VGLVLVPARLAVAALVRAALVVQVELMVLVAVAVAQA